MYKHAFGKPKNVGGTRLASGFFRPRTEREHRHWWYPVVEQAFKTKTKISKHSSRRPPKWLSEELKTLGQEQWLAQVDKKSGILVKRN